MAPPRAYWRGTIRLSLVSVGIRLHAATNSSRRISLHLIHEPTGERVQYQPFVPEVGPVEKAEVVKGYEYERGQYVTLKDEDLDQLKIASKHTIDLVRFVDAKEIDPIYFDRPYFVTPDTEVAREPFIVLRDALRATGKAALGQITLSSKEHIAAIRPCGRGLILETLRYAEDVRKAKTFFDEIPDTQTDEDQLELAKLLIEKKTGPFDPRDFKDHQQEVLRQLIESRLQHRVPPPRAERVKTAKVINLMDALRRSVEEAEQTGGTAKTSSREKASSRPKRASSQKPNENSGTREPAGRRSGVGKRRKSA